MGTWEHENIEMCTEVTVYIIIYAYLDPWKRSREMLVWDAIVQQHEYPVGPDRFIIPAPCSGATEFNNHHELSSAATAGSTSICSSDISTLLCYSLL